MPQHWACTCLGLALYLSNQFARYNSSPYESCVGFFFSSVNGPICINFMKWFVSRIVLCTITRQKNIILSCSECWWPEAKLQAEFSAGRKCHSAPPDNKDQWSNCVSSTPAIFCNSTHVRLTRGSLLQNCRWLGKAAMCFACANVYVCLCTLLFLSSPSIQPDWLVVGPDAPGN